MRIQRMIIFLFFAVLILTVGQSVYASQDENTNDSDGRLNIFLSGDGQLHYLRNNIHSGKALVIVGKVKNNYPEARSKIKLRCVLFDSLGHLLSSQDVYAGNVLQDSDITGLPTKKIKARLSDPNGGPDAGINIRPGECIDFMFVFTSLPNGAAEYRVEPVESRPVYPESGADLKN